MVFIMFLPVNLWCRCKLCLSPILCRSTLELRPVKDPLIRHHPHRAAPVHFHNTTRSTIHQNVSLITIQESYESVAQNKVVFGRNHAFRNRESFESIHSMKWFTALHVDDLLVKACKYKNTEKYVTPWSIKLLLNTFYSSKIN